MDAPLANLKPISGSHSIKEAVLTLFLASKIIRPNEYEHLITEKGVLDEDFQHFEVLNATHIKVEGINVNIQQEGNAGFKFTGFNKGKPDKLLRGMNEENRFFYSFHLFNYKNWQVFKDDFIKYIRILDSHQPGTYVQAYSLTYLDEFIWDNNSEKSNEYSTELVFNRDSDFLPAHFFEPENIIYAVDSESIENNNRYSSRIDIAITDKILAKNIAISHNQTVMLPSVIEINKLIESVEFSSDLDSAHDKNKSILKSILTEEVCRKINII